MDRLTEAADQNQLSSTITIGAVYGIFLVFGQSWADFLKAAILAVSPQHTNEVLGLLLYAIAATVVCVFALFVVVKTNRCVHRLVQQARMPTIVIEREGGRTTRLLLRRRRVHT